jgi:O-methyltransferase
MVTHTAQADASPSEFNRAVDSAARNHQSVFWGDRLLTFDKSAGFLDDPAFARAFATIRGSHKYDTYDAPGSIAWRLHTLVWAVQHALKLPAGDFVECGVFKGDMTWVVVSVLGDALSKRRFYLYDSFEGFSPKLSGPDDFPGSPGFFDFAQRAYSSPGLFESVSRRFAGLPYVQVIRGFLPGSLENTAPRQIAFLHADLNSPGPEIACLAALYDRVVPGGVIVLDDYGWKLMRKLKEAEDRFFAERGHSVLELPTGQGLVIKRGD